MYNLDLFEKGALTILRYVQLQYTYNQYIVLKIIQKMLIYLYIVIILYFMPQLTNQRPNERKIRLVSSDSGIKGIQFLSSAREIVPLLITTIIEKLNFCTALNSKNTRTKSIIFHHEIRCNLLRFSRSKFYCLERSLSPERVYNRSVRSMGSIL